MLRISFRSILYYNDGETYKTLGCIVHKAKLESLLVEERLGQRSPQRVGGQSALLRKLQLREQLLRRNKEQSFTCQSHPFIRFPRKSSHQIISTKAIVYSKEVAIRPPAPYKTY